MPVWPIQLAAATARAAACSRTRSCHHLCRILCAAGSPCAVALIGHASEERFRITYEARQLLRNVYGDAETPVLGVVGKGLLVVPGQ